MSTNNHLYAVIMAGGSGERFWPLGRQNRPKQLIALNSEQTMIEETVQRLFPLIAPDHILVITNEAYVKTIQDLLPIPADHVIGEPERRNTAPCVALAAALVSQMDADATLILLPADHIVKPAKQFQQILADAAEQAQRHVLVTLGIKPTYPATGYGYIQCGEPFATNFAKVLQFKEKPDQPTAEAFLKAGTFLWNSGIFIWRADTIIQAFKDHAPEIYQRLEGWLQGKDYRQDFAQCPKLPIDIAIMEKADNVIVREADFFWNDIGCWSSLKTVLEQDASGNACSGQVLTLDAHNNVLICDHTSMLGVIGLDHIAVVQAGNGMIVCPLAQEQRVKELVNKLKQDYKDFV